MKMTNCSFTNHAALLDPFAFHKESLQGSCSRTEGLRAYMACYSDGFSEVGLCGVTSPVKCLPIQSEVVVHRLTDSLLAAEIAIRCLH